MEESEEDIPASQVDHASKKVSRNSGGDQRENINAFHMGETFEMESQTPVF